MFSMLDLILVYTKRPREKMADKPLALKKGSTVDDLLKEIHKDFEKTFKHALLIDSKTKKRKKVGREYIPKDLDIIEIYAWTFSSSLSSFKSSSLFSSLKSSVSCGISSIGSSISVSGFLVLL